ncbi:F0F1 ATP synthase subunit I [Pseudomonas stutzeri]|nr:F0F1 ATP synthase subunit I [Stutzerimonas stutzeri]
MNFRNKTPLHRHAVFPLLLAQLVAALGAAVVMWLWKDPLAGYSTLLGGMIAFLPNLYFAYKAFRYFGARSVSAIVQSFWAGEMGKLILTAALFALVFAGVERLNVAALFAGYLLVLGIGACALLLVKGFPKH